MLSQNTSAHNGTTPDTRPQMRSIRHQHWCWMANDIADRYGALLGLDGLGLYITLARYANNRTGQCWPSLERLSLATGADEAHLARLLEHLVSLGLITVQERPGRAPLISMLALTGEAVPTSSFTPKPEPEPIVVDSPVEDAPSRAEDARTCEELKHKEEEKVSLVPSEGKEPEQRKYFSSRLVQGKDKTNDETPPWHKPAVTISTDGRPDDALKTLGVTPEQREALYTEALARMAQQGRRLLDDGGWETLADVHCLMCDIFEEWQASAPPCCPTHETEPETDGCTHAGCDDEGICPRCGEFVEADAVLPRNLAPTLA